MHVFLGALALALVIMTTGYSGDHPSVAGQSESAEQVVLAEASDDPSIAAVSPLTARLVPMSVPTGSGAKKGLLTRFRRFSKAPENFSLTPPAPPQQRADNVRGVYLSASSIRNHKFQETIDKLKQYQYPAMIFDVKGGVVFFDTSSPLAKEWGVVRSTYDLPKVLETLRQNGIYSMARFVAIKDENLIRLKPEFSVKHPTKGYLINNGWIDPAHPEAIEYNMQVMCDLAAAGIDEINLDYIRFSTANPVALSSITTEDKIARVETFIKKARETIDRCGKRTRLGISTYAILGWNRDVNLPTLGQDVARFAPYVDIISPMAYPATFAEGAYYYPGKNPGPRSYYLVYQTLKGYEEWIGPEQAKKIRPWIQGYSITSADAAAQIKAVYDAGFCGYQFWNAGNNYAPSFGGMKQMEGKVPEKCL